MPEIGATLRETRMRERIDLSEIEAQTKIRARYLRALENEEWDLLPGPTFIRSFLRTYADALGLDGKALVQEYRLHYEHPGDELRPISSSRRRGSGEGGDSGRPRRPASRGYAVALGLVSLVIILLLVGLLSGGSKPRAPSASGKTSHTTTSRSVTSSRTIRTHGAAPRTKDASVWLEANETVWVCLVADGSRTLIPGVDVHAGERSGPFHAKRFEITLGNNAVTLRVNGRAFAVPSSASALGYAITRTGARALPAGTQPTCG